VHAAREALEILKLRRCVLGVISIWWIGCATNARAPDAGASTGGTGRAEQDSGIPAAAARLRLANLIALAPAIDLCTAVHGSGEFQGPLLESAGLTSGVRYLDVSGYVSVPGGAVDFRLVAAGGDCSQNLSGTTDLTDLPPLAAGSAYTVAEILKASPPTQIFVDDLEAPDSQTAGLRILNASASNPSLDLGSRGDGGFTPWVTGAQFLAVGGTAQTYSLDANGYLAVPEVANVLLGIEYQSADLLDLSPAPGALFPLNGGDLYTLFALPGAPLDALFCADLALLQSGYTACVLYPLPNSGVTTGTTGGSGVGSGGSSTAGTTSSTGGPASSSGGSSSGGAGSTSGSTGTGGT
jgi:hypothetical protein